MCKASGGSPCTQLEIRYQGLAKGPQMQCDSWCGMMERSKSSNIHDSMLLSADLHSIWFSHFACHLLPRLASSSCHQRGSSLFFDRFAFVHLWPTHGSYPERLHSILPRIFQTTHHQDRPLLPFDLARASLITATTATSRGLPIAPRQHLSRLLQAWLQPHRARHLRPVLLLPQRLEQAGTRSG